MEKAVESTLGPHALSELKSLGLQGTVWHGLAWSGKRELEDCKSSKSD